VRLGGRLHLDEEAARQVPGGRLAMDRHQPTSTKTSTETTARQVELAKLLVNNSFADKAFFCNSGTEANEACIKFARKFARVQAGIDPYDANATAPHEIVSFTNCFHGRTMVGWALCAALGV
jgi:acetylornithine/succinyldiaminopimelate/putrescine aminotransferase